MSKGVVCTWHSTGASGRRESWARTVVGLNPDERGAKAFVGEYLESGVETRLPVGSLAIEVSPCGSVKNSYQEAELMRLNAEGEWVAISSRYRWREKFLTFYERVALELELAKAELEHEPAQAGSADEAVNDVLCAHVRLVPLEGANLSVLVADAESSMEAWLLAGWLIAAAGLESIAHTVKLFGETPGPMTVAFVGGELFSSEVRERVAAACRERAKRLGH